MAQVRQAMKSWLAATAEGAGGVGNRHRERLLAEICPTNASVLAERLVGGTTQVTDFGRASAEAGGRLRMNPGEGATGGPRAAMARVAEKAESVEQIQMFETFFRANEHSEKMWPELKLRGGRHQMLWGVLRPAGRIIFPTNCGSALSSWSAYFLAGRTF